RADARRGACHGAGSSRLAANVSSRLGQGVAQMIVDCAHYKDGHRRNDVPVSLEEAATRRDEGGFVWLGLFEPSQAEMDQGRRLYGLHELAVEDALSSHQRPKIEIYDKDPRLVILRTARYDDGAGAVEFGHIAL